MVPIVLNVTFFKDKLLIILYKLNHSLMAIFPFFKKSVSVFCTTLLEPHVIVNVWRNNIPPPLMA